MEVKRGYKQTEVGVIPEGWRPTTLGDLAIKVGSGITPRGGSSNYREYGRPFVRSQNVGWGTLLLSDIVYIDDDTHNLFSATELRQNDVLLNITGASIGRSAIADVRLMGGNVNQHVCIIRTDSREVAPRFINYFLLSDYGQQQMDSFQAGGNREGLNFGQIRSIQLPLPPTKAEQEAIAEALGDADTLIETLEQLLTRKRQLKQGVMQELLSGKKRLPGFREEWRVTRLGQLASIQRGASPRPIESPVWFDENSAVGWVRISDVTKAGMYLYETAQRLSVLGVQHSRPVGRGSLIMSICATVGRPTITEIDTCIHDGFVVFDNLRAEKHFLYYMLRSLEGGWSRQGQTGSQMNLNTGLINRAEILMPPTAAEQAAIAAILSDMDAEITALESKLAKARQIKQGMMQELLTGRIRLV
jgi:type I restriction enzyme S subunit